MAAAAAAAAVATMAATATRMAAMPKVMVVGIDTDNNQL